MSSDFLFSCLLMLFLKIFPSAYRFNFFFNNRKLFCFHWYEIEEKSSISPSKLQEEFEEENMFDYLSDKTESVNDYSLWYAILLTKFLVKFNAYLYREYPQASKSH